MIIIRGPYYIYIIIYNNENNTRPWAYICIIYICIIRASFAYISAAVAPAASSILFNITFTTVSPKKPNKTPASV